MSALPWWAGNSLSLIGSFIAFIIVGFIAMRRLKGRRHPDWKWIDLAIVLVGTIGLFGLTFQAELTATQISAPFAKDNQKYLQSFWIPRLIEQVDITCVPHPRLPSSPSNNEDIEDDRRSLCEWATSNFRVQAVQIVQGKADEIFNARTWAPLPKLRTNFSSAVPFQDGGKWFVDAARSWDEDAALITKASEPVPKNTFYRTLIFFGPYIIALAIAAQIVKIFYEKRE